MKQLTRQAFSMLFILSLSIPILADAGPPAGACGVMGCAVIVYLLILAVALAIGIGIVVFIFKWIKKDARSRGMPNADSICFLALLGLLGLLIYVLTRPQGNVMPCPSCGQPRMQGLARCPQCNQA